MTDSKSHTPLLLVPKSTTLDDLNGREAGLKVGPGRTGSETGHSLICLVYTGSLVYSSIARNYRILQINKRAVSE